MFCRFTAWYSAPGEDYWSQTRRPFACLLFLLPFLLVYEFGVNLSDEARPELLRNGADHFVRTSLADMGVRCPALVPTVVIGGILVWHLCGQFSWKVSAETLIGMHAESLLFALLLVAIGQLQDMAFEHCASVEASMVGPPGESQRIVSYLGAGLYEEVLFRLCLLPVCYGALRILLIPSTWSAPLSIVTTSVLFAVAHYVGPGADEFAAFSFTFRLTAGLYFAALFVARGLGVAIGAHAAYDVLVGVLLRNDPSAMI